MIKAFFNKEWIKTRWLVVAMAILLYAILTFCIIKIGNIITIKGAAHLWQILLMKDATFVDLLQYIPLIIGVAMGIGQFAPEMQQNRIKLTLYLPIHYNKSIVWMLAYGVVVLLVLFGSALGVLTWYLSSIFAVELVEKIVYTASVWFVAGVAAYSLLSWICLEPTWKRRLFNALFSVAFLRLFFISQDTMAYNQALIPLLVVSIATLSFSLLSVNRFKCGYQD